MSSWKRLSLHEVATIERQTIDAADIESGTIYVGLENIESSGQLVNVHKVAKRELASSKFVFSEDHILYGKLRPYLAKIARPEFRGICSTDILPILPGPNLDRHYLAYFLRQPYMIELAASRATGANLPRLSPRALSEFYIPLPPLPEQRRIAAILDQAEALRAKRRQALAQLDTLTQSLFLEMFGDPVTNPRGWPNARLKDCTKHIQIGPFGSLLHREDYVFGGIPLINPKHIQEGALVPDPTASVTMRKHAKLKIYHLHEGDVVMGRRGEMGRCGIVRAEHNEFLCGTGSLFIRPDDQRATALFLCATLSANSIKKRLEGFSLGATLPNLNSGIVENLVIGLPPLSLQHQFAEQVSAVERLKATQRTSLTKLDELFASLQHRAFRGEL